MDSTSASGEIAFPGRRGQFPIKTGKGGPALAWEVAASGLNEPRMNTNFKKYPRAFVRCLTHGPNLNRSFFLCSIRTTIPKTFLGLRKFLVRSQKSLRPAT